MAKINKSEEDWQATLSPQEYQILRKKGTEPPFSGKYVHSKEAGTYTCAACGNELFSSETKFDSGSGWPSFYDVLEQGKVELHQDESYGMSRTEVTCAQCGGHLGHLFEDAPQTQTGLRYCINSAALNLEETT